VYSPLGSVPPRERLRPPALAAWITARVYDFIDRDVNRMDGRRNTCDTQQDWSMAKHALVNQQEFDALLAWLAPCRDQAGEKYEAIRRTLLKFFESRRCVAADEHVDETIDRVARRVAAGELIRSEPVSYFRGVAKNICLESLKQRARTFDLRLPLRGVQQEPPERVRCVSQCLRALPADARGLLKAYYFGSRSTLAASLGITPNALRLRVFKEKQKLRACIEQHLALSPAPPGNIWSEIAT
jgi:DNA-directed RNA polymerase specialized sigma24 family protein